MIRYLFLATLLFLAPLRAQEAKPQLTLQIGHVARVTALAASPNGQLIASGGWDKTAKIWDAKTKALRFSLPHDAPVFDVAFQSDATLATADAAGTVRFFDTQSGALRSQSEGGSQEMSAAALSRDASLAAFALPSNQIQIRDLTTNRVTTLDGHPTRVLSLAFSPDSKTLASSSDAYREKAPSEEIARRSGDVRLWETADGELIRVLRGHALAVRGVAWSSDGAKLASVGESGTAVVWDAKSFAKLGEYNISEGQGRALSVAFSADNSKIVVGWRGGAKAYDLKGEHALLWADKSDVGVPTVAFLADGHALSADNEGHLEFVDSNGAATEIQSRTAALTKARASADGSVIVCAGSEGALALWDARRGTLLRSWQAHLGAVNDIAFSPDGTLLASVGDDKALRLWDLPQGHLKRTWPDFKGAATAVAFSSDGATLAVGASNATGLEGVTLWNVADGRLVEALDEPRGTVQSLAFGPDGTLVSACSNSEKTGELLIWDAKHKLRVLGMLRGARGVALSPDGKKLAGAGSFLDETQEYTSAGDVAQLWSIRAGEMTRELMAPAPDARALGVAFSSDARTFVTASRDGAIRVWDGTDTLPKATLRGHNGPVNAVAFLGQTQTMVSAGNDGTVRLWDGTTNRNLATLLLISNPTDSNVPVGATLSPDWLALTPTGFFDASPGASRYVQWRLGSDVFPVEAFERAFKRPNVLGAILRGENVDLPGDAQFLQGQAIPPQVSIAAPKAGQNATAPLTVQIAASDDKNLKSIQLFVNGRPAASQTVRADAKPLEVGAKPLALGAKPLALGAKPLEVGAKPLEVGAKPIPASHEKAWNISLSAPLPPADGGAGITLKALVTDGDGLQGSDEIRLLRDPKTRGFGTLRVLSVGVSNYAQPAYNLKYAAADATAFGEMWTQHGQYFEKTEVKTLTDAQATASAVEAAIRDITKSASPDDVVAIFLSGHGVRRGDDEFFFATQDINLDKLSNTALPWTDLQEALGSSKARRVLLFLDACHSGGALGARQAGNEAMAGQLVKNAGAIVFSSSLGTQYSFEIDALKHGAFTQALLEGIGQGKADLDAGTGRDGVINVEELLTFLRARVPQLTDGAQMPACPLLRDFGEPFPLAKSK